MTNSAFPQGDPGEEARNRVIQALSTHFAEDRLSLDEFERRVTLAYAVRTAADLEALLRDLPAASLPVVSAPPAVAVADDAPRSKFVMAFLSGVERRGRWTAPHQLRVVALMGGVEIDLREAVIPAEGMEVSAIALMGGVDVHVPPGVRLECDGFAFLGGFEDRQDLASTTDPRAPLVRVTGFAMMGAVDVRVRKPGEPRGKKSREPVPQDE